MRARDPAHPGGARLDPDEQRRLDLAAQKARGRMDERLEEFEDALDALRLAANEDGTPVIVEGDKDETALRNLGVTGLILRVHHNPGGLFTWAEEFAREHKTGILLTDWDRTGGRLARRLKEACEANGVKLDDALRLAFMRATRGEVRDVESLDTYYRNLTAPRG